MISFSRTLKTLCVLCFASFALSAQATQVSGFTGDNAISTWTVGGSTSGHVETGGAPTSIVLSEPDGGPFGFNETTFTKIAETSGTFSFHWDMTTDDPCCSGLSVFNGSRSVLFDEPCCSTFSASGDYSMSVTAGDVIGWGVYSTDTCCGPDRFTISALSAPSDVPEPATIALLGLGLFGFTATRRRKK